MHAVSCSSKAVAVVVVTSLRATLVAMVTLEGAVLGGSGIPLVGGSLHQGGLLKKRNGEQKYGEVYPKCNYLNPPTPPI